MEHDAQPATGSGPTSADAEIAAIKRTLADAEKSQNDVEPLVALHAEGTIIVNIAGRRVLGRETFRQAMQLALESPLAKVFTRIEVEDVRFVRSDVAIVSCTKHVSDERGPSLEHPPDEGLPAAGSLTYVLAKEQDGWRIALAQTTPIAP